MVLGLRIDNWVQLTDKYLDSITGSWKPPKFQQVKSILAWGINVCSGYEGSISCEYDDDEIEPIPLTPEILLACGFIVETNFYERYEHPNLKCRWVTQTLIGEPIEKSFLRFDSIRKPPHTCTDIYFLHQLQNIHFALTQKEITYNPQTTNK